MSGLPRAGRRALLALAALAALAAPARAQEIRAADEAVEAYLAFSYRDAVSSVLVARYLDGEVYLPVAEMFSRLQINHRFDPQARVLSGYYLQPSEPYVLLFDSLIASIGDQRVAFESSDVLLGELDAYLHPRLIEQIFGLQPHVDFNQLKITLITQDTLPVLLAQLRERRRALLSGSDPSRAPPAVRYPRTPRVLDGGVVQYDIALAAAGGSSSLNYALTGGLEVLGGNLELGMAGGMVGREWRRGRNNFRWHYVTAEESRWLTEVALGRQVATGLTARPFFGWQVSNHPFEFQRQFGSQVVTGTTRPDWEVELYLNGRLIGYTRADATGHYQFTVPLTYGDARITLKQYGPYGGFLVEERRLRVPYTFAPPGQVDYVLSLGRMEGSDQPLLQGRVDYGITSALTGSVGLEYLGAVTPRPVAYAAAAARLSHAVTLGLELAPGALYRASMQAILPSNAFLSFGYSRYAQGGGYDTRGIGEYSAAAFAPFRWRGMPFSVRADARAVQRVDRSIDVALDAYLATTVRSMRPYLRFSHDERLTLAGDDPGPLGQVRSTLGTGLLWSPSAGRDLPLLRGVLLRAGTEFALAERRFSRAEFEVSRPLTAAGRLIVAFASDLGSGADRLEIGYRIDFPYLQYTSSARRQGVRNSTLQQVRGTIGYRPQAQDFTFSNREWVGRAGAEFRMFLDADSDGLYDPGEEPVEGARLRFRESSVPTRTDAGGVVRTNDLLPYYRYTIEVDPTSVRNPLWMPKLDAFSFVAGPNTYKTIDVPFYVAGEVDGSVRRAGLGEDRGVGGLRVLLRDIDRGDAITVTTFSDGSFYHVGLPTGNYEARIDPGQLELLGVASDPAVRTFTIEETRYGDIVGGVDFTLHPIESSAPDEPSG